MISPLARHAKWPDQAPGVPQPVEVPGVTCEFRSVDRLHHPAGRHHRKLEDRLLLDMPEERRSAFRDGLETRPRLADG
jgi:hypothetical protein